MKDNIKAQLAEITRFSEVACIIDNYMNYYNNERYQWHFAKLAPNEFYTVVTTGKYPLDIPNIPAFPVISKLPEELGCKVGHNQIDT